MSRISPSTRPRRRTSSDSSAGSGERAAPITPPTQQQRFALPLFRMAASLPVNEINAHGTKVGAYPAKVNTPSVETRPVIVHDKHDCIGGQHISMTLQHRQ